MKGALRALSLLAALLLADCGGSDGNPSGGNDEGSSASRSSNSSGGKSVCARLDEEGAEPCGFSVEDDVWCYAYSTWNYVDVYTWIDSTTVKYEEYANAYHMDRDDSTYVIADRAAMFEQVMARCRLMTSDDE